jgi:hypothetical protein
MPNKDDLLMNVVDYFTEKWNEKRSNGMPGQIKIFIYNKEKKIDKMKKIFLFSQNNRHLEFKSYRQTAPQPLIRISDGKIAYNKRKLNEFIFVIRKFTDKTLAVNIMKDHLYDNATSEESFFNVLQKYSFNDLYYEGDIFSDDNQQLNLLLPASYYGDTEIIEWLINEKHLNVNEKNKNQETGIHLGELFFKYKKKFIFTFYSFNSINKLSKRSC